MHPCVLVQKSSRHKKKHKKEKEERTKDKKRGRKKQPVPEEAVVGPVENGAEEEEEEPVPVSACRPSLQRLPPQPCAPQRWQGLGTMLTPFSLHSPCPATACSLRIPTSKW